MPPKAFRLKANYDRLVTYFENMKDETGFEAYWSPPGKWHRAHGDTKSSTDGGFFISTMRTTKGEYRAKIGKTDIEAMVAEAGSPEPSPTEVKRALWAKVEALMGRAAGQDAVETPNPQGGGDPSNHSMNDTKTIAKPKSTNQTNAGRPAGKIPVVPKAVVPRASSEALKPKATPGTQPIASKPPNKLLTYPPGAKTQVGEPSKASSAKPPEGPSNEPSKLSVSPSAGEGAANIPGSVPDLSVDAARHDISDNQGVPTSSPAAASTVVPESVVDATGRSSQDVPRKRPGMPRYHTV